MTGRELIVFILNNQLEDENISNVLSKCFMPEREAAVKFNVGIATIEAWLNHNQIDGFKIGDTIYISRASKPKI